MVNRRSRLEEEEEEEEEVIALFLLVRQRTAKVRKGEGIRGFYGFQAERTHRS